ncbi:YugN-like family protein [Paenibacillus endoradicis]|uniref:YugN-like family protein n=1 Tax=Paenibacillus endoradicis TaxID=2972487 RepID=UPI00215992A9|nr:YugN-like family protein [Paenibacillus endoradicis]MCR8659385.1 YugN-like family protein [Paenibacillus endoradicis]
MITITSQVAGKQLAYDEMNQVSAGLGFMLGGNWDYDGGFFDQSLDTENKVWLRVPFKVINGEIASEVGHSNAYIELSEPFVLNHLYNEGNDPSGDVGIISASFNQFQAPIDPDAPVSDEWLEKGKQAVVRLEAALKPLMHK